MIRMTEEERRLVSRAFRDLAFRLPFLRMFDGGGRAATAAEYRALDTLGYAIVVTVWAIQRFDPGTLTYLDKGPDSLVRGSLRLRLSNMRDISRQRSMDLEMSLIRDVMDS